MSGLPRTPSANNDVSDELRAFVDAARPERQPILELMQRAAAALGPGQRVADVGAGNSPYRKLFDHADYFCIDWEQSVHEGAKRVDLVASAEAIPLPDAQFDAILMTQVLEHVPEPERVLREQYRLLKPGGRFYMTVPLVWELHEAPHDYFRYTEWGVRHMLESAGFDQIEIEPKCDSFTSLAQLTRNVAWTMGDADDGLSVSRVHARDRLLEMADTIAGFAPLDLAGVLPLGYCASATRGGTVTSGACE